MLGFNIRINEHNPINNAFTFHICLLTETGAKDIKSESKKDVNSSGIKVG